MHPSQPGDSVPCKHHLTAGADVLCAGGKLNQHLLMAYARAMIAICDAQFTAKCLKGCAWYHHAACILRRQVCMLRH